MEYEDLPEEIIDQGDEYLNNINTLVCSVPEDQKECLLRHFIDELKGMLDKDEEDE